MKINIFKWCIRELLTVCCLIFSHLVFADKNIASSLIVNEVMVSNIDEFLSPAFNFDGWIELYNPTDSPIELAGLSISDPENDRGPWKMPKSMKPVPAYGFKVIWFDSNDIRQDQAPFKLDPDGGTIVITDKYDETLVSQGYPPSLERVSYARIEDGGEEWGYTATATPGKTNAGAIFAREQLSAPAVDQPSQLFSGTLTVHVDIPEGTTLYYTSDGSIPTLENGKKSENGKFTINKTRVYRFRLFADGMLPSRVTSRSYIMRDKEYTLPVVSVVINSEHLYNTAYGLFVKGPNGRPGNGTDEICNWNMNWQRPAYFSYLNDEGLGVFSQNVDLEMFGGWSRAYEPRPFKLKGNSKYAEGKNLLYPFFDQKPYIRNRTIQLRRGGKSNWGRLKDPMLLYAVQTSGIDIDCQSYQPVHEFINGEYVGLLNMQEPSNKNFVYSNYGWGDDEIDQFEMSSDSGYVQKCGTSEAFDQLVDLSASAANPETYKEICRRIDIDEYINYMALEMFLGNWDWPQNNIKGFRHRDDGKFRFVLFDLDGAFNTDDPINHFMSREHYTFNQLFPVSLGRLTLDVTFVTLFKNLLKNSDFNRRFVDAFCMMGGSVFEKGRVKEIANMLADWTERALAMEGIDARATVKEVRNSLESNNKAIVSLLRDFAAFGLASSGAWHYILDSDVEEARMSVNGLTLPTRKFDGYLFAPALLRAAPPAGYEFKGWYKKDGNQRILWSTDIEVTLPHEDATLTASFIRLSDIQMKEQGITPVRINEVCGANNSFINEYNKKSDWIELYNTTDDDIDVEGMFLSDDPSLPEKYCISKGEKNATTIIPAHGYLIIWCDKMENSDHGLHIGFKIDNGGGCLSISASDRSWTDMLVYESHDVGTTIVRYPDGGADVYATNVATIGKRNILTTYMTPVEQNHQVSIGNTVKIDDFRLCYGFDKLYVTHSPSELVMVSIFTADGRLVDEGKVMAGYGQTFSVSHLACGVYVAQATDERGRSVRCKFAR